MKDVISRVRVRNIRPLNRLLSIVFTALLVMTAGGCATTVRPPAAPLKPVTIYLTDENIHSSVVLPTDDGRYVKYAFGDWTYATMAHRDLFHAFLALFFSRQAALGRKYLILDPSSKDLSPDLKGIKTNTLVVDRDRVRALEARLDACFRPGRPQAESSYDHVLWVAVDDPYALWSNCNTLTKANLRKLGCEVISRSFFAFYSVEAPIAPPSPPHSVAYLRTASR